MLEESFVIEIRFLTRNDNLRKMAGNWTWPETGLGGKLDLAGNWATYCTTTAND